MKKEKDLLIIYRNYLYSLQERERSGDKYGDTEELIKQYEDILEIKPNKNEDKICKTKSKGE